MICPSCQQANSEDAEVCFTCGKALHALTQGAVLASRYVIRQSLGKGGMGHVYRAYDRLLEEDVAIKVIRPEFVREPEMARRFRSEIRLARRVSHRNVCRIHEYGEDGSLRFLSMEFVEGVDLKRLLRDGPLPTAQGFEVGIQAAKGLQAVHAHGIVHRDLKPSNIMVDWRGVVRLMDFGIAKEAETDAGLTGSGHLMGTPEYMSPEQAAGGKVGYPSDVYALGCVLFEVFTGEPPFHADTPLSTLRMHVHDSPPVQGSDGRPPPGLQPVLRKALAKDPAERYTAATLADALREARLKEGVAPEDLSDLVMGVEEGVSLPTGGGTLRAAPPARSSTPHKEVVTDTLGKVRGFSSRGVARESRRWRWGFAAVSTAALVVVAGGLRYRPPPTVPVGPVSRPSPPASAPPVLEPPTLSSPTIPAPSPRPTPRPTSIVSRVAPTPQIRPAPLTGTLSLVIVPAAEVTVDGESLGLISLREVSLAPGLHVVRILHPDYKPLQRRVTMEPGLTERLVLDLGEKGVRRPRGTASPP